MAKTIVILGGGVGGLVASNELRKKLAKEDRIIVIDKNAKHIFSPSFPWLMIGLRKPEKIQRELSLLNKKGIDFVNEEVKKINIAEKSVKTNNNSFIYDYLILSLGAELAPQSITGLSDAGYNLYELQNVVDLQRQVENFTKGRIAILIARTPFKCPAAPYEAGFLLDYYFRQKKIRDNIELEIFTPEALPMPTAGQKAGEAIRQMLAERSIKFNPEHKVTSVDPKSKTIIFDSYENIKNDKNKNYENNKNNRENKKALYDLLVFIPPHKAPDVVKAAQLTDESGFVPVNNKTLETKHKCIYAIGDLTAIKLPDGKMLPKAGVFAHSQAEVVAHNIAAEIKGNTFKEFDGNGYCFLETGYGKAGIGKGNFYAEKREIELKKPSMIWHLAKIAFEKYWLWKWF